MRLRLEQLAPLALLSILALTWMAYVPGLHGGFLFDDFSNLPALGATGPIDNWPTFWRYITSGTADPTGRPLTLLTFLIDARNWPADPYSFRRTSLILHLLNGTLLALLLRQLGRETFKTIQPARIDLAAALGAGFWLLHPLLVSSTLYIVQREAMLPASFTLLGLLSWLRGRRALQHGHIAPGWVWIALGLGGCTVLSVLSKANGILLPALALVIEYTLLRPTEQTVPATQTSTQIEAGGTWSLRKGAAQERSRQVYRWTMALFGWLPAALVAVYLLNSAWNGFVHGVSALRPWTMGQRLLTEPRVLMQYLDLLWLPRPFTPGLFNDQIKASLSPWSPLTTLPSLMAVLGLIVGAWMLRKRAPAIALAVLFYFVGQSIESSTLALELYFEHRNYMPAMLMFWPLALWLCGVRQIRLPRAKARRREPLLQESAATATHSMATEVTESVPSTSSGETTSRAGKPRSSRRQPLTPRQADLAKGALALVLLAGLALMTHSRAQLWGNTQEQGRLWASLNPDSPRAQTNAALLSMTAGRPLAAVTLLQPLIRSQPDQVQLALNLIGAHCMMGALAPQDLAQARYAMAHTRDPGTLLTHWFGPAVEEAQSGQCRGLTLSALQGLLDAGLANPLLAKVGGRRQDLLYLQGSIALARHQPDQALADFNKALDQNVRPSMALEQAAQLGAKGYPREGLAHLDHYERVQDKQARPGPGMPWLHAWVLRHQHYWSKEMTHLRDTLRADAAAQPATTP